MARQRRPRRTARTAPRQKSRAAARRRAPQARPRPRPPKECRWAAPPSSGHARATHRARAEPARAPTARTPAARRGREESRAATFGASSRCRDWRRRRRHRVCTNVRATRCCGDSSRSQTESRRKVRLDEDQRRGRGRGLGCFLDPRHQKKPIIYGGVPAGPALRRHGG